ncbi:MAG: GNAT family N-acetyltransferase [Flavobacteriales bacterium]|nr:GNAT family N-acetyltransferase [Flavobacteriales bacterium]
MLPWFQVSRWEGLPCSMPEARGTGVGEALVRACITQAKSIGAKAIVLWSQPTMLNAHRLY